MIEFQKIKIESREYDIIDSMQDFRAEDSFIHRSNKLAQFKGNGESKKHVGTYVGEKGAKMAIFFDYNNWGVPHIDKEKGRKSAFSARESGATIQNGTCFFSKSNLLKYLDDAKAEYFAQEQVYHNDISTYYDERYAIVQNLPSEYLFFSIYDASDNLDQKQNRGYIRSDDAIWNIWRELILPKISYLSILKLASPKGGDNLYYFRILLDYQYRTFIHPSTLDEVQSIEEEEIQDGKKRVYRIGAERYRREVLEFMPQCPFTKISDERLLIASHIKPYSVCIKEGREDQALDYLNGLSLSPTFDRLFDQGYITFSDEGNLICGTQLSSYTWSRLSINPTSRNKMRIFPEDRHDYLEYHRKHIFLDNIEDLI